MCLKDGAPMPPRRGLCNEAHLQQPISHINTRTRVVYYNSTSTAASSADWRLTSTATGTGDSTWVIWP